MGGSMKKIKYRNVRQYFSYRRIQQKAGESCLWNKWSINYSIIAINGCNAK